MDMNVYLLKKGDACLINGKKVHIRALNRLKAILWYEEEYSSTVKPIHFTEVRSCSTIKFASELV